MLNLSNKTFICAGNIKQDLIYEIERLPEEHEKVQAKTLNISSGGSASNTAYWLAQAGLKVKMLAAIGDDHFGKIGLNSLEKVGIDIKNIQLLKNTTTGVTVVLSNSNSKSMISYAGANALFDVNSLDQRIFGKDSHLHLAFREEDIALKLIKMAKANGSSISCEFNGAQSIERAQICDLCLMNWDELVRWLGKENPFEKWKELSDKILIVTKGKEGASVISRELVISVRAEMVQVVDRTGGGDAFNAGFILGYIQTSDWKSALESGLNLAQQVINHAGTRPAEVSLAAINKIALMK